REELLTLLKIEGVGRVRARKLHDAGIKTIGDVKKVDLTKLTQILGKGVALSVKKAVGETIDEPVPEKKRKGQMGLGKYS
ncbi:MAG: helix-hairpin-helix domain-containing protein, partial [Nanoarchaeota archaeon]